jgi:hypothetical protein
MHWVRGLLAGRFPWLQDGDDLCALPLWRVQDERTGVSFHQRFNIASHIRSGLIDERCWICWNAATYSADMYQYDCNGMWMRESASGGCENYRAVRECRHIIACSRSNIHIQFCLLHENSGCLFVLGFGTRKTFSKYGSSQYVLPLGHTDAPVFSFWHYRHVFGLFTDWLQTRWTHNSLEHEGTWIERNMRVGPLVLLDASPCRTMVWNSSELLLLILIVSWNLDSLFHIQRALATYSVIIVTVLLKWPLCASGV